MSSQKPRITNRMFLFVFYIFSMSHGRAPIARPFTFWIIGVTVHDISRVDWSSVSHDRSSYGTTVPFRDLVARTVELVVHHWDIADHRIRTACKEWHDRASLRLSWTPCCTGRSSPTDLGLSEMHGRSSGRTTVPLAQVSFLTECPQLCRFVQKVLVFTIISSGMLF